MPVPIRSSQRAVEKEAKQNDISLENVYFLFYFECDNSYMVFGSGEKSWPETMLNSHKVSLQRKDPVNFPKIGVGKFQSMGSNDEMMQLGSYLSSTNGNVDNLDITQVMRSIRARSSSSSDSRKRCTQSDSRFSDESEEEEEEESDIESPEISASRKRAKTESQAVTSSQVEMQVGKLVAGTSKEASKCSSCGHSVGERAAMKDLVCEKVLHVIARIEQRLDKSNALQKDVLILSKKAAREIEGIKDASKEREAASDVTEASGQVFYNDMCLTNLGGETPEEKGKRIARRLWSKEELAKLVIDPKKELRSSETGRTRADPEREEKFKQAIKAVLGDEYTRNVYRRVVRLVNVMGNGYKNKGFKDDEQDWLFIPKQVPKRSSVANFGRNFDRP